MVSLLDASLEVKNETKKATANVTASVARVKFNFR
jgi:hypothetical protein